MVLMKRFCCCFDIRTGILLIGATILIGGVFTLVIPYAGNNIICSRIFFKNCKDLSDLEFGSWIIWSIINITFAILMIYGSQKNKLSFILPMLILYTIDIILNVTFIWIMTIKSFKNEQADSGISTLIAGHVGLAFMVYYLVVIYSRYKDLKADQSPVYPKENYPLYP